MLIDALVAGLVRDQQSLATVWRLSDGFIRPLDAALDSTAINVAAVVMSTGSQRTQI